MKHCFVLCETIIKDLYSEVFYFAMIKRHIRLNIYNIDDTFIFNIKKYYL